MFYLPFYITIVRYLFHYLHHGGTDENFPSLSSYNNVFKLNCSPKLCNLTSDFGRPLYGLRMTKKSGIYKIQMKLVTLVNYFKYVLFVKQLSAWYEILLQQIRVILKSSLFWDNAFCLPPAFLGLFFDPEDGDMFLRNVDWFHGVISRKTEFCITTAKRT
jgi:hypothetical protein